MISVLSFCSCCCPPVRVSWVQIPSVTRSVTDWDLGLFSVQFHREKEIPESHRGRSWLCTKLPSFASGVYKEGHRHSVAWKDWPAEPFWAIFCVSQAQTPSQDQSVAQDKLLLNSRTLNLQRGLIRDNLPIAPWKGAFGDDSASSCCGVLKAGILSHQDTSAFWSNKDNLVTHGVWQPWKGHFPYYHQHTFPWAWSNPFPSLAPGKKQGLGWKSLS